jgi:hypothetical protein
MWTPGQALNTIATVDGRASDYVVTLLYRAHLGADSLDNARRFVAQDSRSPRRQRATDAMKITVADAGGDRSHEHFAGTWLVDLDLLNSERLIRFAQNGGFDLHGLLLSQALLIASHHTWATGLVRF